MSSIPSSARAASARCGKHATLPSGNSQRRHQVPPAGRDSAVADSAKRRFATEAQITAQLKTPNAVQVFDFGVTDEGQPYLVMELLDGETMGRRIERLGRLNAGETARLLGPCARALHRAHQLGIVHRDFKPDNVIICTADHEGNELVKVLDFGIAKLAGALDERPDAPATAAPRGGANRAPASRAPVPPPPPHAPLHGSRTGTRRGGGRPPGGHMGLRRRRVRVPHGDTALHGSHDRGALRADLRRGSREGDRSRTRPSAGVRRLVRHRVLA